MPQASVFGKALRDVRWQVFWYGLGLALLGALVAYIYPSYRDQLADFEIPDAFKAFLGENADYASPEGYLTAEFFSWTPILLVIFALMQGTNLIGGEESNGTIDILLAQPIRRRTLLIEKFAAYAIGSLGIAAFACAGWFGSIPFVDIDISLGVLLVATFNLVPVTLMFGALALYLSVALPARQQATGVAAAISIATYMVNYLASLVDVLKPFRWLSPFHYANTTSALSSGIDWPKLGVLVLLIAIFVLLAVRAFERRDIGIRGSGRMLPALLRRSAGA